MKTLWEKEIMLVTREIVTMAIPHLMSANAFDLRQVQNLSLGKEFILTHSHTMTPFDAPGKQAI